VKKLGFTLLFLALAFASCTRRSATGPAAVTEIDRTVRDAAIGDFVHAMGKAGIRLTSGQVVAGLEVVDLATPTGEKITVAGYRLDPDPEQQGEALEGWVPLFVAHKGPEDVVWTEAYLKELAEPLDFLIGTHMGGYGFAEAYPNLVNLETRGDFNLGMEALGPRWNQKLSPPYPGPPFYDFVDSDVNIQVRAGMVGFGHLLVWGWLVPDWLRNGDYSAQEILKIMKESIRSDVTRYRGKILYWNVVNEYGSYDFFLEKIGPRYLKEAYRTAREADPSGVLVYNDYDNHTADSPRTGHTKAVLDTLLSENLVDMVGLETVLFYPNFPSKDELIRGMRTYGLPVMVTEFTPNMGNFQGPDEAKWREQARIYHDAVLAALESGVCRGFIMIFVSDAANPWNSARELPGMNPRNDPSPFDREFRPKPCYYAARTAIFEYLARTAERFIAQATSSPPHEWGFTESRTETEWKVRLL